MEGHKATAEEQNPPQPPLFPEISLPRVHQIQQYQNSTEHLWTLLMLPTIDAARNAPRQSLRSRGAPVKPKNMLGRLLGLKNTRGKMFKFSFIPQILVSHLQHFVGNKQRTRKTCLSWMRSDTKEGQAVQSLIWEVLGEDVDSVRFKRTVSLKDLKDWLDGLTYSSRAPVEELAAVRHRVFRLFCVLKSIDIEARYGMDFNVETTSPVAGQVFKWYITKFLWEELGLPPLTSEEILETIKQGLARVLEP